MGGDRGGGVRGGRRGGREGEGRGGEGRGGEAWEGRGGEGRAATRLPVIRSDEPVCLLIHSQINRRSVDRSVRVIN
jgi:hypothetical protein